MTTLVDLSTLGVKGSVLPVTTFDNEMANGFVVLKQPGYVVVIKPVSAALVALGQNCAIPLVDVIVFSGSGKNWKIRLFHPANHIIQDPATGSAA